MDNESNNIAPSNLPKEIQDAINLLWKYSEDGCISGRTKEECEDEGYETNYEYNHYLTFVIGRRTDS